MNITEFSKIIDGKCVVNTTPHSITFQTLKGDVVVVPTSVKDGERTSEWVVNASAVETPVAGDLVKTEFRGTPEGLKVLDEIEAWASANGIENLRVIGSMVAAQAYPGRVLGMCPAPGFERVPTAQRRMTTQKFTVYGG